MCQVVQGREGLAGRRAVGAARPILELTAQCAIMRGEALAPRGKVPEALPPRSSSRGSSSVHSREESRVPEEIVAEPVPSGGVIRERTLRQERLDFFMLVLIRNWCQAVLSRLKSFGYNHSCRLALQFSTQLNQ